MNNKDIRVTFGEGFQVKAECRGHLITTDQPVSAGGQDSAPTPLELFLISIATCAGFFVLAFLRQRQIQADGVYLTMSAEKSPNSKLIENITIDIHLPEGFPDKYREAVVKSADQCAVKAHLLQPPKIEIRAVKG
ncbi:MAG TPA: OsmC family protein [Candidatus Saccharicenans sp.]|jgi:ribosomal protein S12 methylthiotransferase accessory factor|nr:OsmC family protein [Candidatus Saccharicenans sp.]HRD01977.1 OsmC family protein [Candidatus Saccharicenans sp.]